MTWQPIETAPKDGTEILIAAWVTPDGEMIPDFVEPAWSIIIARWEHGSMLRWSTTEKTELREVREAERIEREYWSPDYLSSFDPQMWMPLPAPPPPLDDVQNALRVARKAVEADCD